MNPGALVSPPGSEGVEGRLSEPRSLLGHIERTYGRLLRWFTLGWER